MSKVKTTLTTVLAIVIIVVISVNGYQLSWWLKTDSVNRTSRINQNSYGRQNALTEQILDDIREVEGPNVPEAQKKAITAQICDSAAKLNNSIDLGANAEAFIARNC